jgi:hypothetical protein
VRLIVVAGGAIVSVALFDDDPSVATIISQPLRVGLVTKVNGALPAPAATVTDAGSWTPALLDLNATTVSDDAAAERFTTQLPEDAGFTETGLQTKDVSMTAVPEVTDKLVVALLAPYAAVNVTFCGAATAPVAAVNVPVVALGDMVTDAGTVTVGIPPEMVTSTPAAGAALLRITVQTALEFGASVAGVHWKTDMSGGPLSESVAVFEEPASEAVTVAVWSEGTVAVVAAKEAPAAPAGTITDSGTERTFGMAPEIESDTPPFPAAFDSVTAHVALAFDDSAAGAHWSEETSAGASSGMVAVRTDPLRAAETVALWSAANCPAVTTAAPVFDPAGIITVDGAVRLPVVVIATVAPGDTAALLSVMAQFAAAPGPRDAGLHDSESRVTGDNTVMMPGLP